MAELLLVSGCFCPKVLLDNLNKKEEKRYIIIWMLALAVLIVMLIIYSFWLCRVRFNVNTEGISILLCSVSYKNLLYVNLLYFYATKGELGAQKTWKAFLWSWAVSYLELMNPLLYSLMEKNSTGLGRMVPLMRPLL
jgi:hypothetical protein